jgi:hypothetical protein
MATDMAINEDPNMLKLAHEIYDTEKLIILHGLLRIESPVYAQNKA